MIESQSSYSPEEVEYLLKMQHIATRNAMMNVFTGIYDYNESIGVGSAVNQMQHVTFENTRIDKSNHYYAWTYDVYYRTKKRAGTTKSLEPGQRKKKESSAVSKQKDG